MKTASAKAKGRRACSEAKDLILKYFPEFPVDDIQVASSGSNGEDLLLSNKIRDLFPFAFEVKNQEALNIWAALKQAESHVKERKLYPAVIFKRNNSNLNVAMELEVYLIMVRTLVESIVKVEQTLARIHQSTPNPASNEQPSVEYKKGLLQ